MTGYSCQQCGTSFGGRKRKFCTTRCMERNWYANHAVGKVNLGGECKHCGCRYDGKPRKFCSLSCRQSDRLAKRELFQVACHYCGNQFSSIKKTCRFCSLSCSAKFVNDQKGTTKRTRPCKECAVEFLPKDNGGNIGLYCSRQCYFVMKNKRSKARLAAIASRGPRVYCRMCVVCRSMFETESRPRKKCLVCTGPRPIAHKSCRVCGAPCPINTSLSNHKKYCSSRCSAKAQKSRNRDAYRAMNKRRKKRIKEIESRGEKFSRFDIYERDKWKCQICKKLIDRSVSVPHPLSATLDHILPTSRGGEHTRANVRCAHFLCNVRRSNKGTAQQVLFG